MEQLLTIMLPRVKDFHNLLTRRPNVSACKLQELVVSMDGSGIFGEGRGEEGLASDVQPSYLQADTTEELQLS